MTIPKKITPSPIIEAVTEIRFDNSLPGAVIFGKLYAALSEDFPQTEQLPILEMPAEFRDRQPDLKFTPHYRLKNDKFIVNIGQRMISVNRICLKEEYTDWDEYYTVIKRVFKEVEDTKFVEQTERISVNYINFFEQDVATVLNLEVGLFQGKLSNLKDLTLKLSQDVDESIRLNVSISSNAAINAEGTKREGLVVNFEAANRKVTPMSGVCDEVVKLHEAVEQKFFASLNDDFLKTLSPKYE